MSEAKKITLRLPCEVYEALEVEAEKRGVSVNCLINNLFFNFLKDL